ncbi:TonB-dependent receptor [Acidovorax sp. CCYZU-2555]|uniref:TonB-dependent siderophore receptor n=1 Tax=Acidovorax sp. CCYZU-2555 TaxID=2835042 RepID=UPI001BCD1D15|nr:TonB-dependent receptor [Acidovorax sp. CCYZU-2555]MBS7777114.1 TonB-dependent siderophore receptor [Acidovorax sp. CCYZU-2555]
MSTHQRLPGVRAHGVPSSLTWIAAAALLLSAQAAVAQTPAAPHAAARAAQAIDFDLPSGPLGQTLLAIAQQGGQVIATDPALVAGRQAPAVRGRYSPEQAARLALAGQPLALTRNANGVWSLAPAALAPAGAASSTTLSEVRVTAQGMAGLGATTEGTGSYTTHSASTATRLNLSLRETPQSVSVMTRQQIEDQGLQSVEDVALQVTGLTLTRGAPERTQMRARGFNIGTIMVDGVPTNLDSDMTGLNTLAMYDHVEVLRGAAGLLQGTGNPSATINLLRKRPTHETQVKLTGSAGRWNNYRTELDAGGPLNAAGTLRGRTVIAYQDTDSFRDHYNNERRLVYGTLEADLGPDTTLSVGAAYNREVNNGSAWYGLPTYSDGSLLPVSRSANYTPPWAYWNKQNQRIFADLEHRWQNGWKAKLSAQASNADMAALYNSTARVAGGETLRYGFVGDSDYTEHMRGLDLHASGPLTLLGRKHDLLVGATWRNQMLHSTGRSAPGYSFVFDPTQPWQTANAPYPTLGAPWGNQLDRVKQYGSYVTTRLNLADPLKLILGSRLDWYDYETSYNGSGSGYSVDRKFTPYAGVVYDLDDTYSLYGSWTKIFQPQGSKARSGTLLPPVTGTNYEVGIKGEYLNGALNGSLAAFKILQTNLARSLPSSECAPGVPSCAEAAGEVESKGLELEIAGQLASSWQVTAGYTFAKAQYTQATSAAAAGARFATDQPRHLFKLFTTYRLPGELNAWRAGGGLRLQSDIYQHTGNARVRQGGYAVVDLMVAWQATPNLDLRLNVANLFDKHYYESIGSTLNGNGFGAPRNWLLTANYRF